MVALRFMTMQIIVVKNKFSRYFRIDSRPVTDSVCVFFRCAPAACISNTPKWITFTIELPNLQLLSIIIGFMCVTVLYLLTLQGCDN